LAKISSVCHAPASVYKRRLSQREIDGSGVRIRVQTCSHKAQCCGPLSGVDGSFKNRVLIRFQAMSLFKSSSAASYLPSVMLPLTLRLGRTSLLLGLLVASLGFGSPAPAQSDAGLDSPLTPAGQPFASTVSNFEQPVPRFKRQAIQRIALAGGWTGATSNDDLSSSFLDASIRTGIPLGSFDNILGITPSFRVDWIDANSEIDIPEELYNTGVEFFYRGTISERWKLLAILRPAIRSDFTTSDNALRIFGLGLMIWDWIPERLSMSFGAVYLDRADLPVLPALGLIWTPRPKTRLELQFPRTRFAHRITKNGSASETWSYFSAGIGGNTWAVSLDSGGTDELSIKDIRLVFGLERIVAGGGGWLLEAGYAFDRSIEYESSDTEIPLSDGVILTGGWAY
jgi:hypothetical protein